jgi:hypothetical protein
MLRDRLATNKAISMAPIGQIRVGRNRRLAEI